MGLKQKQIRVLPVGVRRIISAFLAVLMVVTSINYPFVVKSADIIDVVNANSYEIPISFEDETKRDSYTKHFRKLDGSYEVSVYDEVIHYLKNNEWKEINNGYQHIYIYDRADEDGTAVLIAQKENIEHGGDVLWPWYASSTWVFQDIPIDNLTHDYFTFRARASGTGDDDWVYNDLVVKVEFSKL